MSDTKKTDLAICPFCGGEAEVVEDFYDCPRYWVRCKTCAGTAYGPDENDDKDKAIIAWNRRFVCFDKNGDKVYAGDDFNFILHGQPPIKLHFVWDASRLGYMYENEQGEKWAPRSSDNIELVKEAKNEH